LDPCHLYPVERLTILTSKATKFQLFTSLTLDIIWFSRNKLVHDNHQPDPAKLIIQRSSTLNLHLEAWNAASSPSLLLLLLQSLVILRVILLWLLPNDCILQIFLLVKLPSSSGISVGFIFWIWSFYYWGWCTFSYLND